MTTGETEPITAVERPRSTSNTMPYLPEIRRILDERGLEGLARSVCDFARWRYRDHVWKPLNRRYWNLRRTTHTYSVNGVGAEFHAHNRYGGFEIRYNVDSETPTISELLDVTRPDDVVLDVGANVGIFSAFLSNYLEGGEVIGVEPHPANLIALSKNLELNSLENSSILAGVLSSSDGIERLGFDDASGISALAAIDDRGSLSVPSFTGDRLVREGLIEQPNVVKIDVEGAEGLVLEGMSELLSSSDCRHLFCEIHKEAPHRNSSSDFGHSVDDVLALIENSGYSVSPIEDVPARMFVRADRR